jgi:lysophospholipase L1-like esterase
VVDFSDVFQVEGETHLNYDHVLPDHCHFTEQGYSAWTQRLLPELDQLL